MSSSASQSLSKYYSLFYNEKTCSETETKIHFISYIWYDDHILGIDENNWQCLWCNTSLQVINATKDISRVLGKKGMHIYKKYVPKYKDHIKTHQELQQSK